MSKELIERLRTKLEPDFTRAMPLAEAERAEAADLLESLQADAQRYRKLRNNRYAGGPYVFANLAGTISYKPEGLDIALDAIPDDAALSAEQQEKGRG